MEADNKIKVKVKVKVVIQSMVDGEGTRHFLPPRKKRVFKNNLVIRLIIPGTLPSKKNCQVADTNKKKIESILRSSFGRPITNEIIDRVLAVKPYIRNSSRYKQWEDRVRPDLVIQCARWHESYKKHNLSYPITAATISIYHYWADPKERDNSNKAESIHDTLVAAGIISADSSRCLYKNTSEAGMYKGEILKHQTIVVITAHEW